MACRFEYKGKTYDQDELVKALEQMLPHEAHKYIDGVQNIPDAPFKKNWHELALKRAIREAAENGYERLSWTPGEAQAARYDLSKQVNLLSASKNTDGTYLTYIEGKNGQPLFRNQNGFSEHGQKSMTAEELENTVGKEVAKKIIEGKPNKYGWVDVRDKDLKIGGEGMKGFYDQIIPKSLEKIAKEFGVKVQKGEIGKPETKLSYEEMQRRRNGEKPDPSKFKQPIFYIDIPPAMRQHAMQKGFPLFSHTPTLVPINYNPFENEK
jgi:hypothetical protein